ncbi:hypothetical protein NicSoilB4_20670 [Arthrobacter sp. NicSoilB4]|nr:hypothetical protein NicSoilB4_20670 [Arthrobacter sp. NicSoilB4]
MVSPLPVTTVEMLMVESSEVYVLSVVCAVESVAVSAAAVPDVTAWLAS